MTKQLASTKHITRLAPAEASLAVARDLLRLVAAFGTPARELLQEAGLAHLAGCLLGARAMRFSQIDFARLYAHCTWVLDAAAARQENRDPMPKAGIDLLCHCVMTCRTLREAIGRMDQFSALLVPRMARLYLVSQGDAVRFDMKSERTIRNACAYLSDLTGLAMYHRLFGWLVGETLPLLAVGMRYPPQLDPRTTACLMPYPITHDAAENHIVFSAGFLDRPLVRGVEELERMLVSFPFDLELPQSRDHALSERIHHLLVSRLAGGGELVGGSAIARQFSISLATLKRRLEAEGTSLGKIRRRAREELAERMLADPRLSVTEVARALQFSDAGAFRRAFHLWKGISPSEWRRK